MIGKKKIEKIKKHIEDVKNRSEEPVVLPEYKITFGLTEKQWKKYQKWRKAKTKKEGELYVGAVGGAYSFCFTPTGIGEMVTVRAADGEVLDITEYEHW